MYQERTEYEDSLRDGSSSGHSRIDIEDIFYRMVCLSGIVWIGYGVGACEYCDRGSCGFGHGREKAVGEDCEGYGGRSGTDCGDYGCNRWIDYFRAEDSWNSSVTREVQKRKENT